MALNPVIKVRIACHSSLRDEVLSALETTGSFQPVFADPEQDWLLPAGADTSTLSEHIENLDSVIEFLRESAPGLSLAEKMGRVPRSLPVDTLTGLLNDSDLQWRARRAWRVAMLQSERKGDLHETSEEISFLSRWEDLTIPLDDLGRHGSWTATVGTAPAEGRDALFSLDAREPLLSVVELGAARHKQASRLVAVLHEQASDELRQELALLGYAPVDFGGRRGRISELLTSARLRQKALEGRIAKLGAEAGSLAAELDRFENLRDAAGLLMERLSATGAGRRGERLFLIHGWIREKDLDEVVEAISRFDETFLERVQPCAGEEPPSAITESGLVDPYTMLTDMFGNPSPSDPDPTPLMAPFYALFLGVCVGDAGYGFVLSLISGLGLISARRQGRRNRLFGILFHGGLAAMVVGLFLGAWFGIDRTLLPSFLSAPAGLLDSLVPDGGSFGLSKQFLYVTMALGVIQLLAGVVINFLKRWRSGERITAILEQSGWVLSSVGLFPWLFNHYLLGGILYDIEGPLDGVFLMCLLAGAILIFIMGGREAKGFGKLGIGAMAVYGIANLLADVLSYSRLFALSLSGGIIATVVNQISGMLPGTDIPGVGLLISIPVLLFGHLFNLSMGVLGGFIHTARLQFVEFFGKFYEGTGSPFAPLRYKPQYINIIRKNPEGSNR